MLPDLISSLGSTKMTRGKLQDAVVQRGFHGVRDGDDGTATSASGAVEKMGRGRERVEWQGKWERGSRGRRRRPYPFRGAVAARDGELVRRRLRARSDEQWGRGEKTTKAGRWQLGHLGRPGGLRPRK